MSYPNRSQYVRTGLQQRRRELTERRRSMGVDLIRSSAPRTRDVATAALRVDSEETLQAIDHACEAEILEINEALQRLDQGTYGLCKHCGRPITPLRLASLPQAVTCTQCPTI